MKNSSGKADSRTLTRLYGICNVVCGFLMIYLPNGMTVVSSLKKSILGMNVKIATLGMTAVELVIIAGFVLSYLGLANIAMKSEDVVVRKFLLCSNGFMFVLFVTKMIFGC